MFTPLIHLDAVRDAEVLEYVFKFGEEYCPRYEMFEDEYERVLSIAPYRFIARYNERGRYVEEKNKQTGKMRTVWKDYLQDEFSFNEYTSNRIPKLLKKLGLDEAKFWYLIRFLYDYAYGYCKLGKPLSTSPKKQLENFCRMFKRNPTLHIELKDKNYKLGIIDDYSLLTSINTFCLQLLQEKKYFVYGDVQENKKLSDNFFTYYMAKQLRSFFILMGLYNKRTLQGEEKIVLKADVTQVIIDVLSLGKFFNKNVRGREDYLKKLTQRYSIQDTGEYRRENATYPLGE